MSVLLPLLLVSSLLLKSVDAPMVESTRVAGETASNQSPSSEEVLRTGGAQIEVALRLGQSGPKPSDVLDWVKGAANAVATYYGVFPVRHARVVVTGTNEEDKAIHGTTWGDVAGVQGLSRMRLGQEVTKADLDKDWTMTHELVHMAFSSLPEQSHWLEEGLATYVEPIARAQAGQLRAEEVWEGMITGMPHGEPKSGDHGLDQTHTWGRTYWGGAMFCLVADVRIRQATQNRKGLQDALRAIVAAHATIDTEWPLERVLKVGDQATDTAVLSDLYSEWKDTPVPVDLNQLWLDLGVKSGSHGLEFDPSAPLAPIRDAILSGKQTDGKRLKPAQRE